MKHALVVALLVIAQVAHAAPHQVLVMRAEGTADTASRTSIDSHVMRLAKHIEGKVEAGDITLTEAAAAVGCNASEPSCKDELLATLGVDELVATTVTATPTGLNITVRRISKGGARAAQTTVPSGTAPDARLDTDIGPLFGVTAAPAASPPVAETPPPPSTKPQPTPAAKPQTTATSQSAAAKPGAETPAAKPAPTHAPPTRVAEGSAATDPAVTAAPAGAVTQPPAEGTRSRRWQKIGMGAGAALVVIGMLMWGEASDVQDEIDALEEPRSRADFQALRDLERRGDDLAGGGNFFFLVGAAVGGVSAYYYWRAGKSTSTRTARIAPTAFPGGAGVTLTVGGMP